ncbi:hypothetical protein DWG18_12005 [Lysobacter sp. TY2-98]|uniref:hypothetical protein n=1 Tax=Lysobacter sp. TY2-98 TaxID=2290922 RepID=UPI000E203779|nr:hypothetical protein [Lysobacter sp. TY2-98]AXK72928.1 hypothetical protein DWG18_12005 [Lysobacter sp. TY2-98]
MSRNIHDKHLNDAGRSNPPSGPDDLGGRTHALRAGRDGPTQRKSALQKETPTRDAGSDDRRSGSESHRDRSGGA